MKTKNQSVVNFLLLILFFTGLSYGQETYTVTLNVDLNVLNRGNPSKACTFSSDAEVIDNTSPESFTILVAENDEIIWEAFASDGQELDVETIEFITGSGVGPFGSKKLEGEKNRGRKKKVKGKVKRNMRGQEFKYNLSFGVNSDIYVIDPKIKIGR
ncbi:hypothetical protein [Pareuzebyella sediminis]|uniref:hypothetical protein n=1 Tax=Pareuzebyella sediminis TaxID=2607998 RepID=UPI0011ECAA0C|nr:hypothetical protein [Pareuzebyella sediminis]